MESFRIKYPKYRPFVLLLVPLLLTACSDPEAAPTPSVQDVVRVPSDAPTISDAVNLVAPGGLILVREGTYRERVLIDKADVTLRGVDRNKVIIDGEGIRSYGVVGIADGVRVENLTVTQATLYGVLITGMHSGGEPAARGADGYTTLDPEEFPPLQRYRVDHVTATNNGLYGIYAFNAQHGVITDSYASGSADSGIYLGQCETCDAVISNNVATLNAVGFENANASGPVTVHGNALVGNRVGLTLTTDYQEAFVPQQANVVAGNLIASNQSTGSPAQADGGYGIGIGISGGQENVVTANQIVGHVRSGVVVANTEDVPALGNQFLDNRFAANALNAINISAARTPARDNCGPIPQAKPLNWLPTCPKAGLNASAPQGLPPFQVPAGVSFLDVKVPQALPSLDVSDEVPEPLPSQLVHPKPDSLDLPPIDLLTRLTEVL